MPRKHITLEVKDQNRECQRRSRARRKELVDDLKKQLEEYQRQGATASLEMQKAARAVNFENQRLRSLLHLLGVSQGEIQQYLASPEHPVSVATNNIPGHQQRNCAACGSSLGQKKSHNSSLQFSMQESQNSRLDTDGLHILASTPSPAGSTCQNPSTLRSRTPPDSDTIALTPASDVSAEFCKTASSGCCAKVQQDNDESMSVAQDTCGKTDSGNSAFTHNGDTVAQILPPVSDCFCPPDSSVQRAGGSGVTSCDTAAAILMELHGHLDADRVRATLGCVGSSPCSVGNTKVFQLMDKFA
ncbi:hypothetical protein TARUN_3542 [Trichoderma arundinaceum]|uniref:Bzip transcription factor n=1 Tax=Trichoderma arundinaceum TaxID=490622 RepID=A0A395NRX9_TRIAR|nr:hypothetical protein TARUN_3542 [Trichoderma arundinaceum]